MTSSSTTNNLDHLGFPVLESKAALHGYNSYEWQVLQNFMEVVSEGSKSALTSKVTKSTTNIPNNNAKGLNKTPEFKKEMRNYDW